MPSLSPDAVQIGRDCLISEDVRFLAPTREQSDCTLRIGDEVVIRSGTILYGGVTIASGVTIDHMCVIREGSVVGEDTRLMNFTEVGRDVSIGGRCRISGYLANRVRVEPDTSSFGYLIHSYPVHGSGLLEPSPRVGRGSMVGRLAVVAGDVELPAGARIPAGSLTTSVGCVDKEGLEPGTRADVLAHFHREHLALAKQAESQLGLLNTILVPVITAAVALAVTLRSSLFGSAVGALTVVIGTYGLLASSKYLEAYWKQYKRAQAFAKKIDDMCPELGLAAAWEEGRAGVQRSFRWTRRIPVRQVLQSLYAIAILAGILIMIISRIPSS